MENLRRQRRKGRGRGNQQFHHWTRKRSDGIWRPCVPTWEREFCSSAGVSWSKILDTKTFIHLFPDVLQWNDSAGEEAFKNAKTRFCAEIKCLPCDKPLPDPDMYIDQINWDAEIDTSTEVGDDEIQIDQKVLIFPESYYQPVCATGWDDPEENCDQIPNESKQEETTQFKEWGEEFKYEAKNEDHTGGRDWRMREGPVPYDSRVKTSRFQRNAGFERKNGYHSRFKTSRFQRNAGFEQKNGYDSRFKTSRFQPNAGFERKNGYDSRFKTSRFQPNAGFERNNGYDSRFKTSRFQRNAGFERKNGGRNNNYYWMGNRLTERQNQEEKNFSWFTWWRMSIGLKEGTNIDRALFSFK